MTMSNNPIRLLILIFIYKKMGKYFLELLHSSGKEVKPKMLNLADLSKKNR